MDSLPDYGELKQRALSARQSPELQLQLLPGEQEHFQNVMRHFQQSAAVKDQALGLYVNSKVWHGMRLPPRRHQAQSCRKQWATLPAVLLANTIQAPGPNTSLPYVPPPPHLFSWLQLFKQAVQEFEKFLVRGMLPALRDAVLVLPPGPAAADGLFPLFAQFVLDHYMDAIRHYRQALPRCPSLQRPCLPIFPECSSCTHLPGLLCPPAAQTRIGRLDMKAIAAEIGWGCLGGLMRYACDKQ